MSHAFVTPPSTAITAGTIEPPRVAQQEYQARGGQQQACRDVRGRDVQEACDRAWVAFAPRTPVEYDCCDAADSLNQILGAENPARLPGNGEQEGGEQPGEEKRECLRGSERSFLDAATGLEANTAERFRVPAGADVREQALVRQALGVGRAASAPVQERIP
jgi:hypothetical protein